MSSGPHDAPLLVVGAGPKGVALGVKAQVLRATGLRVPEVIVVERQGVGAAWRRGPWTNGKLPLASSPHRDLGYPYRGDAWGRQAGAVVRGASAYGWHAHLIAEGRYQGWVDRGSPPPTHDQWADYLRWAARTAGVRVVRAHVTGIDLVDGQWELSLRTSRGNRDKVRGGGLVITGMQPSPCPFPHLPERVLSQERLWQGVSSLAEARGEHITVVGAGESAGTVAAELSQRLDPGCRITLIGPGVTAFSRGESYLEQRLFSDPTDWPALPLCDRRDFLHRTERGVMSPGVQSALAGSDGLRFRPGRVTGVSVEGERVTAHVAHSPSYSVTADRLVWCAGGDRTWFLPLFGAAALAELRAASGGHRITEPLLERRIEPDLSVSNLRPRLHLPTLAGLAQGPGFPHLGCLGLLSDRILATYARSSWHPAHPGPPGGRHPQAPPRSAHRVT